MSAGPDDSTSNLAVLLNRSGQVVDADPVAVGAIGAYREATFTNSGHAPAVIATTSFTGLANWTGIVDGCRGRTLGPRATLGRA